MRKSKIAPVFVGAVTLALVAAGCGGGSDNNSGDKSTGASTGGTGTSNQVLTVGMPNGPQQNNSNPFLSTSAANSMAYAFAIYEPLAMANDIRPDTVSDAKPWLAQSWTWNKDFTQIKLVARDGVKWSDGQPMTADDIAYSFQIRKDTPALNTQGLPIKTVTTDGNTVTVDFTGSQFVNQIKVLQTFIIPKHIWEKVSDPATYTNQSPVGTGPFTLKTFTTAAATLVANPNYWGTKPAVQTVRYQSYTGNDALTTALATGQAQWGWTFISNYQSVYVNKDSEHNKAWFPAGLGIDALYLNTQKAPFNDVAVRKAANQVLDRQKASAIAEAGIFPELTSITGIPTPSGDSFLAAAYKGQNYKVDVAGAKKTLTDAGYKYDGDKLIGKDGKQVSVTLTDPAGWNDYDSDLSLIQTSFKSIGIDAKVTTPTADAWTTAVNQGDFQATLHWTNGGVTPWEMYSNIFDPSYYVPLGKNATWNFGRYNDPTAKKYFADYLAATDDAGRSAALDQLQKIWVDDVPALGVDQRPAGAEFSTKYFTGWPGDDNPYANPQPSSVMASLVLTSLKPAS